MLLITHLVVALSSIVYTTYLLFRPSKTKFTPAYWLVGATIASGTLLVWQAHSPLLSSCITGLFYLAIVTVELAFARHRLSIIKQSTSND